MTSVNVSSRPARRLLKGLQHWFNLEGSLSLLLPPGLEQPMGAGGDILASLLRFERAGDR